MIYTDSQLSDELDEPAAITNSRIGGLLSGAVGGVGGGLAGLAATKSMSGGLVGGITGGLGLGLLGSSVGYGLGSLKDRKKGVTSLGNDLVLDEDGNVVLRPRTALNTILKNSIPPIIAF